MSDLNDDENKDGNDNIANEDTNISINNNLKCQAMPEQLQLT